MEKISITSNGVKAKLEVFAAETTDAALSAFAKLLPNYLSGEVTPDKFLDSYEEAVIECERSPICGLVDDELVGRWPAVYTHIRDSMALMAAAVFPPVAMIVVEAAIQNLSFGNFITPIL